MGFSDKDTTVEQEVTSKPIQVRFERNDALTPPVDVYVVFDVDGHSKHKKVEHDLVKASWTGSVKSLKNWVLAIIDAA